jgi:hypothetical protein
MSGSKMKQLQMVLSSEYPDVTLPVMCDEHIVCGCRGHILFIAKSRAQDVLSYDFTHVNGFFPGIPVATIIEGRPCMDRFPLPQVWLTHKQQEKMKNKVLGQ